MTNNEITHTSVESYSVDIHIAGNVEAAREICRRVCMEGLCVSLSTEDFIFTGGMESGVRVGLINYPRFPLAPLVILDKALRLAKELIVGLHQSSCCVVAPDYTIWLSRRV